MSEHEKNATYKIWAVDGIIYGPADLDTLTQWIDEERITRQTWVYHCQRDVWLKAASFPELQAVFNALNRQAPAGPSAPVSSDMEKVSAGALRRLKILSIFDNQQLERIKNFLELHPAPQFSVIVKLGDPGDAMFMVLEGQVRVRFLAAGRETILATLSAGEFFGELCLFDHGPRSADVVANVDTQLVRMSAASYHRLLEEDGELAAPFLAAICKTLAARMRADNKRLRDAINITRAGFA